MEGVAGLIQAEAAQLDFPEVGGAEAQRLGQPQGVVAAGERRPAAAGAVS